MASSLKNVGLGNICPVLSSPNGPKRNRLPHPKNGSVDLSGCYRGQAVLPRAEQNISVPSNPEIPPPVLQAFLKFKVPFTSHKIMGKALY